VLAAVLGDESGSRMYWELVDAGRVEHASLTHYEYLAAGCFMTYLSCDPAHTADNMRRVLSIFRQAEAEGVAAEEIDQVKSKINSRLVLGGEKPSGRLFTVGNNWLQRREYRTVAEEIADVDAVTAADVARVLAKYPLTRSTTLTIGPLEHVDPPE